MKKIFTKLFLLTTLLMLSSELWAQSGECMVLNDPGPRSIGWIEEQTFSFNLVGPAKSISFKINSRVKMAILKVYGYRESDPTNKVPIAEYKDVEGGVFQYTIEDEGFSRIEITAKSGRGWVAELLNVRAFSPYYPYESGLGSAEYNSADASTSFTIDYYGTPNFKYSYESGDSDKFPVSISASGGKATVTVKYLHNEVGEHKTFIIISNGVFKTIPYKFSGTTTQANQTIAWTPPTEMTVGDTHTLSATATSGDAVAFAISGDAATLAGNTLTAVKAGTVTITASQAGNGNYNAASVTKTITIKKATPTVTAWPTLDAVTYGANLAAALVLKGGSASVAGTFVITDAYTAATVPNAGAHTYNLEFRPTESNKYNNVSGTATLTVNKADQVIAWDFADYTLLIGKTLELDATATCGAVTYVVNGTAISVSGTILTAMEEGTATIKATCAGDTNYNDVESIEYTITVEKDDDVTTGLDNTPSPMTNGQKIIYNGQLLIIRDGKTYNAMGQEVK